MNIDDLRKTLFKELEALNSGDLSNKETLRSAIDHAHAVTNVADAILNSCRVELEYMRIMERKKPLTQFVNDDGMSKVSAEKAAQLARDARNVWAINNPDKVRALNSEHDKTGT